MRFLILYSILLFNIKSFSQEVSTPVYELSEKRVFDASDKVIAFSIERKYYESANKDPFKGLTLRTTCFKDQENSKVNIAKVVKKGKSKWELPITSEEGELETVCRDNQIKIETIHSLIAPLFKENER